MFLTTTTSYLFNFNAYIISCNKKEHVQNFPYTLTHHLNQKNKNLKIWNF